MTILTESITQKSYANLGLHIRMWRAEPKPGWDVKKNLGEFDYWLGKINQEHLKDSHKVALYLISNINRANAIEVKDPRGNGTVLYSNWP